MPLLKTLRVIVMILIGIGVMQLLTAGNNVPQSFVAASYGSDSALETLILLHGSPGDKEDFRLLGPELGKDYRVYALDLPCFGEQASNANECGIEGAAEFVASFIDTKGIKTAHIAGYSWGGGVAISFAARYPEKTKTLTLLSAMGIPEGEITGSYEGEYLRTRLAYPFVVHYPGAFGGDISWRKGFMRSYLETDLRTVREHLATIRTPALVLQGARDTVIKPEITAEHARLLRTSVTIYPGTHITLFSDVSELAPLIREFIDAHTTKGAEARVGLIVQTP